MADAATPLHAPPNPARHRWLLAAGTGGFALGALDGACRQRYHGLLIAAAAPPLGRVLALHSVLAFMHHADRRFACVPHRFGPAGASEAGAVPLAPEPYAGPGRIVHWYARLGDVELYRTVQFLPGRNAVRVIDDLQIDQPDSSNLAAGHPSAEPRRVLLRPLTPLRSIHTLDRADDPNPPTVERADASRLIVRRGDLAIALDAGAGRWIIEPQWWRDLYYEDDAERGQDCREDVWSPGVLSIDLTPGPPRRVVIEVELIEPHWRAPRRPPTSATMSSRTTRDRRCLERLSRAADQFIVARRLAGRWTLSILAGYPWFADWGRDAMIALPGLLLTAGRFEDAADVLTTFAMHERRGLIPNHFHEHIDPDAPHTAADNNTVDASLWFIHAAEQWRLASGRALPDRVERAAWNIIRAYRDGTDFRIAMDEDGLIAAGDESTQLTWMDAQRDGVTFTPRHGKAVEINALWYNALRIVTQWTDDPDERADLMTLADRVRHAFAAFWCDGRNCCHDVLARDDRGRWVGDATLRPNQIFAVSLPHSPLDKAQQRHVVDIVEQRLLTPFGLRTLDPDNPNYRGRFAGNLFERDAAYHRGTVWPWLIGPFADAVFRAADDRDEAQQRVRLMLDPLLDELDTGCRGQLAEVYDGDAPHRPAGCVAQAWSVAEVLRTLSAVCKTP